MSWQLGFKIKHIKSIDAIDVKNVTDTTAELNIATYNKDADYKYVIFFKRIGNQLEASLGNLKFQGTLDQIAPQIAARITGIR